MQSSNDFWGVAPVEEATTLPEWNEDSLSSVSSCCSEAESSCSALKEPKSASEEPADDRRSEDSEQMTQFAFGDCVVSVSQKQLLAANGGVAQNAHGQIADA